MISLKQAQAPITSVPFPSGFYSFPCCGILLSATLVYFSIIISMSTIVMCICHVGRLEQHHNSKHAAQYVATKKLNKLDNRKNFQF